MQPKLWNGTDGSSPPQRIGTIDVCGGSFVKTSFAPLSPGSRNIRKSTQRNIFGRASGSGFLRLAGSTPVAGPIRDRSNWSTGARSAPSSHWSCSSLLQLCSSSLQGDFLIEIGGDWLLVGPWSGDDEQAFAAVIVFPFFG